HNGNGTVSAYTIDQTAGSLTPIPGSPFTVPTDHSKTGFPAPGTMPCSITVHATAAGQALYVADSFQNDIWQYVIEGATGALALFPTSPFSVPGGRTSVSGSPVARGPEPAGVAPGPDRRPGGGARQGRRGPSGRARGRASANPPSPLFAEIRPSGNRDE